MMPKVIRCSYGRQYFCQNPDVERATRYRYEKSHVDSNDLEMQTGGIRAKDVVWIVHSHHAARHHSRALTAHLVALGIKKGSLRTVFGFRHGHLDGRRKVGHAEICQYSFRHRWIPAASKAKRARPKAKCIVYIEATARPQFDSLSDFVRHLNVKGKAEMHWLGYRKVHPPNEWRNAHPNEVIEGSKLIAFRGSSLQKVFEKLRTGKRYCHLDLWFCRHLKPSFYRVADVSLTSTAEHISVCGGSKHGPKKRLREEPGKSEESGLGRGEGTPGPKHPK